MNTTTLCRTVAMGATFTLAAGLLVACSGTSDAKDEAVTVNYLHRLPDGDGMVKVDEIIRRWNTEHPEVQVTATKFDGKSAEMIKKLETDIKADNGPCLAQLGYGEVPEMFVKGMTEDVTEYAEKYQDNYSGAFSLMKVGETVVGLPQDTGPLVYYYNKQAFEDLGITVPTTIADFQATAAKAAVAGKYIAAFQPDEASYWLSAQSAAAGGSWYNAENDAWRVTADSDASQAVASFWQEMLDDATVLTLERWGEAFSKALVDQQLIGTIGAAWEAPLLADAMAGTANEGQWAVAQIPDFGAGAITGPDGGSGVAVVKGCKYPEQAMEFNNWFNTQIDDLATQGLVVAALGNVTTPDSLKAFYGGQDVGAELAKANANMSSDFGYMPFFSAVGAQMNETAAAAGGGTEPVSDVFNVAQSMSIQALEDNGLPVTD